MFLKTVVEKLNTHFLCSLNLFWKSFRLCDNVENYGRARLATDNKAQCMLDDFRLQTQQQLLHESPSILRLYAYCLSFSRLAQFIQTDSEMHLTSPC
jgi:hypothetical protein